MKRKIETSLQKGCVEWFRLQYSPQRLLLFANNQNGKDEVEQKRLNAMGVNAGTSDLIYLSPKGVVCIEMKRGENKAFAIKKGNQSDSQKEFQKAVESAGYRYEVIDSIENFMQLINSLQI